MMREELASWLRGAEKVVVIGIGSSIRTDDAVGTVIVRGLKGKVPDNVKLFVCETSPENYISTIRRNRPTHVLIIDAADIRSSPGSTRLVDPKRMVGSMISTHTLPLKLSSEYIEQMTGASVRLLAIQPESVAFGKGLTGALGKAASENLGIISGVLNAIFHKTTHKPSPSAYRHRPIIR